MKKILCLLLCLCLLGSMLVACGGNKNPDAGTTGSQGTTGPQGTTGGNDTPADPTYEVKMADLSKYKIVYRDGATYDLSTAAEDLAIAIEEKLHTILPVITDFVDENPIGDYEILLGATNRPESVAALAELGVNDYAYLVEGKKIIIVAHDDYTASLAVQDFVANLVDKTATDALVFMASAQNKSTAEEYTVDTLTVGGVDIAEYSIVYPAWTKADEDAFESTMEKAFAIKLQSAIAAVCGKVLTVKDDSAAATGKEILVGLTARNSAAVADGATDKGYVALADGNIQLAGNTAYGIGLAVDSFIALFANATAAETDITVTAGVVEDTDAAISSMSLQLPPSANVGRQELAMKYIVSYLPDTIGLQGVSKTWRSFVQTNLSDYYEIVGVGRDMDENGDPTGETNYVLYAKDKFELVDSGTKWLSGTPDTVGSTYPGANEARIYTWVTLKNADDVAFMHINTAFDASATGVRQAEASMILDFMYENNDKAIVVTGNFLAATDSAEYTLLISEKLNNAAAIAADATLSNRIPAEDNEDYVFVDDEFIDVTTFIAADERVNGDFLSKDNVALYIEFTIDMDGTDVADKVLDGGDGLLVVPDREGSDYSEPEIVF